MDIRTKLIFALVAASLGGMLALGGFAYTVSRDLLTDQAIRQLEAVAETKKQDLQKVITAWRDRVQLVTGSTALRNRLAASRENGAADIEAALADAVGSVRALRGISVYGPDGRFVASSGLAPDSGDTVRPASFMWADEPVVYENVSTDPDGTLLVTFIAPIRQDGTLLGAAKVRLSARELIAITQDTTGLGDTGETLMARRTDSGGALILNPLRHDEAATLTLEVGADRADDPALQAALGKEGVSRDGVDYRGHDVLAATRYLEEFGWGLVVKVDAEEQARAVAVLRDNMWKLAVSLSAFAIIIGTLLGLFIARPIRELADVARRIADGEHDLRAQANSDDEIGHLARSFNEMTEELVASNRALEKRVRDGENGGGR